jgi:hypothetical protein
MQSGRAFISRSCQRNVALDLEFKSIALDVGTAFAGRLAFVGFPVESASHTVFSTHVARLRGMFSETDGYWC